MLDAIGVKYAQDFITSHFGFDLDKTPPYLPMALGAGQTTPLQLTAAYAVLANGGYKVNPYLITQKGSLSMNLIPAGTGMSKLGVPLSACPM